MLPAGGDGKIKRSCCTEILAKQRYVKCTFCLFSQFQELVDYIDGGGTPPPNTVLPASGDGKIKRSSCTQILAKQQVKIIKNILEPKPEQVYVGFLLNNR